MQYQNSKGSSSKPIPIEIQAHHPAAPHLPAVYCFSKKKNTIFIPLSSSRTRTALPGREARTAKAPWSCNRFNRSTILDGPQTKTICH